MTRCIRVGALRALLGLALCATGALCQSQDRASEAQINRLAEATLVEESLRPLADMLRTQIRAGIVFAAALKLGERVGPTKVLSQEDNLKFVTELARIPVLVDDAAMREWLLKPYREFSSTEADEAIRFFETPTGRKVVRASQGTDERYAAESLNWLEQAMKRVDSSIGGVVDEFALKAK